MAGRISAATERAIKRVQVGEQEISAAARAEGIDPSTLFRALKRRREIHDGALGRTVIVGAGALGRELRQWILIDDPSRQVVFLDDQATGPMVIGNIDGYQRKEGDEVLIAIADPKQRQAAAERFSKLGNYFAANTTVGDCKMGEGCLLLPYSLVSTNTVLGTGCVLNLYTSIGHDAQLGDFCQLSSHVDICGWVKVGARCFFGSGARVIPKVTIGDDCIIGAGAVVIRDVPSGTTVVGNPARAI